MRRQAAVISEADLAVARPRSAAELRATVRVAASETDRVDPARVRQAVHNLVDNALRHGGGSTVITISAARRQDRVRIGVDDRGPGFTAALLTRVFDPFTRGPQPAEQLAGAGLGLAIVSAVAKAHGGSATAGNRDGGGARVEVVLAVGPEGHG